jgi:hypothetical protein
MSTSNDTLVDPPVAQTPEQIHAAFEYLWADESRDRLYTNWALKEEILGISDV